MNPSHLIQKGSETAKGGFRNEDDVKDKFNSWNTDKEAQAWLIAMGYNLKDIDSVEAIKINGSYKADIQVKITIYFKKLIAPENISIKLVSNPQGFNQIDKRWVKNYVELWNITSEVEIILKLFTGEIEPIKNNLTDQRRMFLNEMEETKQKQIVSFFEENKVLVVSDIIKGRGKFSADWMLVILKNGDMNSWVLKEINEVMNIFSKGKVRITSRGSLKIGQIGMQRKGGDGGRDSAKMLQFKINPVILFK